ncbi:LamG domain-containing protein [Streptomyces sp. NBC_01373]|uniref:LamG domain-containing protein n=1 Tax=Streptomyces sp. NBC_01373 TaxID=2903843 RepID=UPI002256CFA4|nr:LamG domain-containing protein [Streptomyces sp. NBC_01373]MCX4697559.1 LamG domain-containing protein [Streptomyces sp. NBC_01373]
MHDRSMSRGSTSRGFRSRRSVTALALALTAPLLTVPLTATDATAITAPVALTADDLPTWQTNGIVHALAQADGTVFAGGTFSAIRPAGAAAGDPAEQQAVNFAAFDAATGAPTGCTLSFTVGEGVATVRALDVSPDGQTLYAGGYFGAVNGVGVNSLAAIDIDTCTPNPDFHPAVTATVRALDVTDSTVYLGGDFGTVNGQTRERFAAVDTAGALTAWTANADEPGRAVEVAADGQHVVIGGDFFTVNGANSHALAVTDATTGAVTTAYPSGFFPNNSVVKDITADASGVYTASEGTGGGVFDGRAAFEPDTFAQRWRDTCLGATQALQLYQGVVYSASHAHDCSTMGSFPDGQRRHLLAQTTADPALLGWVPDTNDGIGEGIGPRVFALAPKDGTDYLWVGGEFTTVDGTPQQALTRFASGPDTGAPTVPQVKVESIEADKVAVHWRSSFDTDDSRLTYRVYKDGGSTPVYEVTGDSLPWSRPQITWTDPAVAAGETHSYRISASDGTNTSARSAAQSVTVASAADAYAAAVRGDGAGLYWRFNETANAYAADSSGADDSGVHWNAPTQAVADGAAGSGSSVGYTGSQSEWTYTDKRHATPSAYSLELWFKTTTTTGGKLIGFANKVQLTSTSYDKHLYLNNAGRLYFGVYTGTVRTINTTQSFSDGAWHHVVATQGSGGLRLYVDGTLRASNALVTTSENRSGFWRVGGDNLDSWPSRPTSRYYTGLIDEVAVYGSALTASQVTSHYATGTAP